MEHLGEFITNHLVLVLLFVIILFMLIKILLTDLIQGGSHIDATEATRLINREDAIVLDIRDSAEFTQGHIISAVNIPFADLSNQINKLDQYRNKPVIICCRTGMTAGTAIGILKKSGIEKIYRLKGGIDGWKHANLPLATS